MPNKEQKISLKPKITDKVASPIIGTDLLVKAKVHAALDGTEKGAEVASYFGIGGEEALQPLSETNESCALLDELRTASKNGTDLTEIFSKIADQANDAMIDADALRALMYKKTYRVTFSLGFSSNSSYYKNKTFSGHFFNNVANILLYAGTVNRSEITSMFLGKSPFVTKLSSSR